MMRDKEIKIYDKILLLRKGDEKQRKIAIECEKLLADECSRYSLDEKLEKIELIIEEMWKNEQK